jgi:DNA-directed RNA polymerase II subunit RPB2
MNNEISNINKEENIEKDNINIELNSLEFEKYTWEIIKKYFDQDNGKYIINHILSSYNDFVFRKIDDIIDGFNPINIQYNYVEDKDIFQYNIKLNILNPRISKPMTQEKNGTIKIMTPNEARQRNFCYSGNLCVDLEIEIEYYNINDNNTNEDVNEDINEDINENINEDNKKDNKNETNNNLDNIDIIIKKKIIQNINLGKIPIMVNSKYCVLNNPNLNLNNNSECKYDLGGYFIINGNEKVVISQDRIAGNKTYVFKDTKSTTYSYIAEIRSVPENIFSPQKLTILKLSTQENSYGKTIKGVIHHIKYDIPIFILFRALGIESDKEIIKYILFDLDNKNNKILINNLKGCVEESNYYLTQFSALEYISKYLSITGYSKEYLSNKTHKIKIIKNILKNDFLPHVSQCYKKKAIYLGYMIRKLILCSLNIIKLDDRDSYINKRIDTPGIMMSNLFRQYYGKLIKDMKIIINKEYSVGSWKVNNDFINIINKNNIYKILKSSIIEGGFKYSLATGNWGIKNQTNKSKQGVAQVLNRLTFISTLSHLRRVNTPMEKNGKLIHPRKLHTTQWGYICPSETPEGASIGLVKNLSMISTITCSSDSCHIRELLNKNKDIVKLNYILEISNKTKSNQEFKNLFKYCKIKINGDLIGYCKNSLEIYNLLKYYKRNGIIHIHTSISWIYKENIILINTEAGRCVRPLYVLENKNNKTILRFNKKIVCDILNKKYDFDNLIYNSNDEKDKSIIEFIDAEESNNTLIAINHKDIKKGFKQNMYPKKYKYLEIHPSLTLGLCASNIPFPDHNQAPRNTYQSAMSKQAIGVYMSNFRNRMDTLANILNYPQVPLVRTRISDITNCNNLPYGNNVIVAIACFTGFNQEDSIMINKSAVHRGFFNSTFYRTYKDQCNKNHSTGEEENYCIPDKDNTKGIKPFNYNKLNENGFVEENIYVENSDIIIGKTMHDKSSELHKYKDNSVYLKQNEYGFIDKNFANDKYFKNINNDGYKFSKIKIRNIRIPTIGDKMSSRHGQKGIIGMVYNQEDMPFTKDGIVPDIIVNPHAIPSRMTIAQLIECIMSKLCLNIGKRGYSTSFMYKNKNEKQDEIASLLSDYGYDKHGNEIMYNPRTGEQIDTPIFIGPTYYQRLKHMVHDKIHSRSANGPIILLTRQPAEGRAREGGLRLGEMEVECNWGHGTLHFLKERLMECSDNYRMFICKKCKNVANVNTSRKIYICYNCDNRIDFSQIRIPYACKLLLQEIAAMSINTKFITN